MAKSQILRALFILCSLLLTFQTSLATRSSSTTIGSSRSKLPSFPPPPPLKEFHRIPPAAPVASPSPLNLSAPGPAPEDSWNSPAPSPGVPVESVEVPSTTIINLAPAESSVDDGSSSEEHSSPARAPSPTDEEGAVLPGLSGDDDDDDDDDALFGENLSAAAVEYNVLDYGAVGDGETDDAQAFSDAWAAACNVVAAYVHVPAGKKFKVYPLTFTGPCQDDLIFKVDGTILAPQDPSVWTNVGKYWLEFKRVSVTLQGTGEINGQGQTWWANSCKTNPANQCVSGPTAVVFDTCTNVTVKNVAIVNSQQMCLAFEKSLGIVVNNINISAPGNSPNTDGIHLQNSSSATIKNSVIGTGDDCISIQTGSFSVKIKNVTCGPSHGISVGGLGKANATAEVADLVVDNVIFNNCDNGVRIKSWQGSSGYAKDFTFKNLKMVNTKYPIVIDQYYCDSATSGSCGTFPSNVAISDISYKNITGTSATNVAVKISCSETVPCTDISLNDIDLVQTSGDDATSTCTDAWGSASNTVVPSSCLETS